MLADTLARRGYRLVEFGKETDLLVLNTCSVTENAEKDCRYAAVSYTHLRAHETVLDLVCRLLLEKKNLKTL